MKISIGFTGTLMSLYGGDINLDDFEACIFACAREHVLFDDKGMIPREVGRLGRNYPSSKGHLIPRCEASEMSLQVWGRFLEKIKDMDRDGNVDFRPLYDLGMPEQGIAEALLSEGHEVFMRRWMYPAEGTTDLREMMKEDLTDENDREALGKFFAKWGK